MADQHNDNIPALTNSIAEDIVDIKENLEFHKDCFQALCEGWDNSTAASLKVDNLADDAVVTDDILDDAVTDDKIDWTTVSSSIGNAQMADNAIGNAEMADDAIGQTEMADSAVGQAELKTSMSSVSQAGDDASHLKTLPGGEYGFYPQIKGSANIAVTAAVCSGNTITTSYVTDISLKAPSGGYTVYAQQRYVTASGEVFWIFILRDKITKEITSVWQAPDHPCFGNGGKPQLVPHPFPGYDDSKYEIIVINPSKEQVLEMQKKTIVASETKPDKDLIEVILEDYDLDETTEPAWPTEGVTVGLPPDWEKSPMGVDVKPIRKIIPKPAYIKTTGLKIKQITPMEL